MALVDVVVVSYNSRGQLRDCVGELAGADWTNVIVVDNESADRSLDAVAGLPVDAVASGWNGGFAFGVNTGWRRGSAPYVLLLNPDARLAPDALRLLVEALERDPAAAIAGPRIVEDDGAVDFSQRRFPRLRSTFATALFLHRFFPRAAWTDELIRDASAYTHDGSPDWVSGACMLVRRSLLEQLGGLDEGFFMFCEDTDICKRARDAGFATRFVAAAACAHEGGASTPSSTAAAMLARSRRHYAAKHDGAAAPAARLGIALGHATHVLAGRGGSQVRAGHLRALRETLRPASPLPSRPARVALAPQTTASGVDAPAGRA